MIWCCVGHEEISESIFVLFLSNFQLIFSHENNNFLTRLFYRNCQSALWRAGKSKNLEVLLRSCQKRSRKIIFSQKFSFLSACGRALVQCDIEHIHNIFKVPMCYTAQNEGVVVLICDIYIACKCGWWNAVHKLYIATRKTNMGVVANAE